MSIKEAIKKMKCEERACPYLDAKGIKTFCTVLRTDKFCGKAQKKDN